jgi:hypothetical protein
MGRKPLFRLKIGVGRGKLGDGKILRMIRGRKKKKENNKEYKRRKYLLDDGI